MAGFARVFILSVPAAVGAVGICGRSSGAIMATSVSQSVSVMADAAPTTIPFPMDPPMSTGSQSNATLLPISMMKSANSGMISANASQSVTYVGPTSAGAGGSTASLAFNFNQNVNTMLMGMGMATAMSSFSYQFDVTTNQPYTYSASGLVSLAGPGGPLSTGSGTIAPGSYTISSAVSSSQSASFNLQISAPVPEPTLAGVFAGCTAMLLRRTRRVAS